MTHLPLPTAQTNMSAEYSLRSQFSVLSLRLLESRRSNVRRLARMPVCYAGRCRGPALEESVLVGKVREMEFEYRGRGDTY